MEKNISERLTKDRIHQERRLETRQDISRKTVTCRNRELYNRSMKNQIDFESVIGKTAKLQRTGEIDLLSPMERNKLYGGTAQQKKIYGRYGLSMTQSYHNTVSKTPRNRTISQRNRPAMDTEAMNDLERDLNRELSDFHRDENYRIPIIEDTSEDS